LPVERVIVWCGRRRIGGSGICRLGGGCRRPHVVARLPPPRHGPLPVCRLFSSSPPPPHRTTKVLQRPRRRRHCPRTPPQLRVAVPRKAALHPRVADHRHAGQVHVGGFGHTPAFVCDSIGATIRWVTSDDRGNGGQEPSVFRRLVSPFEPTPNVGASGAEGTCRRCGRACVCIGFDSEADP